MTQAVAAFMGGGEAAAGGGPAGRVAFLVSQFPETHETFIVREFAALDDEGLDFVIFSLKTCRDKVVQSEARRFLDRTIYPIGARTKGRPGRFMRSAAGARGSMPWFTRPLECAYVSWAARRFTGAARALGVGHIHAHWATAPTSAAVMMSRALGVSYSFTAHAWDIYAGDGMLAAKARGARFVATCTKANMEHIRSLLPAEDRGKVVLNYHGVGAPLRTKKGRCDGDVFRIAAVGRLVETKGFGYLLEAAEGIDFPFELTIVGEGPLRGGLERRAGAGRLAGKVRFAGVVPVEEVYEILAQSDVFVMPSVVARNGDRDGIPNVLLEAMSAGVPVVASAISGIPEAVVDGQTGVLVGERDSTAIRTAIERLYREREDAERLAGAGRDLVRERFDAEKNARALYGILKEYAGVRLG